MSRVAFTVGHAPNYDASLRKATDEDPMVKVGRHHDYDGGWVWRTSEEARAFLGSALFSGIDGAPPEYDVYELELPTGWETDVSKDPLPRDGVHRLLSDARIVRAVR